MNIELSNIWTYKIFYITKFFFSKIKNIFQKFKFFSNTIVLIFCTAICNGILVYLHCSKEWDNIYILSLSCSFPLLSSSLISSSPLVSPLLSSHSSPFLSSPLLPLLSSPLLSFLSFPFLSSPLLSFLSFPLLSSPTATLLIRPIPCRETPFPTPPPANTTSIMTHQLSTITLSNQSLRSELISSMSDTVTRFRTLANRCLACKSITTNYRQNSRNKTVSFD